MQTPGSLRECMTTWNFHYDAIDLFYFICFFSISNLHICGDRLIPESALQATSCC
ncbi:unnamed protein product [Penicillium roqueforti FM164]|uniref:Genomic scaffold, ProqFM164S03 n=1 Tax=Penicillium roqueforti (strain FM164) TaxID=1365484 RepID=W6QAW6_PENRF|nr:unnamed protein product [Penicillium roqueforti FM164]